jgi:pyrroline-5-carboxylate reductase
MSFSLNSVGLVGCGNMGSALLRGWLKHNFVERIFIVAPHQESVLPYLNNNSIQWLEHPSQLPHALDCVVFAVKPQILPSILSDYQHLVSAETLFISIVAGKSRAFFKKILGDQAQIGRCMPNTPAAVGLGVTLAVSDPFLSSSHRSYIEKLMGAVGSVQWLEDEKMIDIGGALTGCGPAYIFQFIESLAEAALSCGFSLNKDTLGQLVQEMVVGSLGYLQHSAKPVSVLRAEVTSPQGMTEAALNILKGSEGLTQLLSQAITAAIQRAHELGQNDR